MEPRREPGVSAQWTHEAAHEGMAHLEHPGTSSDVKTSRSATGRRARTADVHDHRHIYEACDLFDWAKLGVPNAQGSTNLEIEALPAAYALIILSDTAASRLSGSCGLPFGQPARYAF